VDDAPRRRPARAAAPRPQSLEEIDVDRDLLWDSPEDGDGEFYAWMAGESATVKTLRRLLVSECGVDRKRVAFMGYWRRGQSERVE
jgi:NADPH-dependent ferric siderophore reductase